MTYLVKPCPFCGLQMQDSDADDYLHQILGAGTSSSEWGAKRFWSINCLEVAGGCGVQMLGDTEEEVIHKWNRRVK